jgi:uncharacterized repeat protein (TIGR01451 family)
MKQKSKLIFVLLLPAIFLGLVTQAGNAAISARQVNAIPVSGEVAFSPLSAAGIDVTPLSAEEWGMPDGVVTFSLTVKNTGSDPGDYTIGISGNTWNTWSSPSSITALAGGTSTVVSIMVAIPGTANTGDSDSANVTVTLSGAAPVTVALTTRAVPATATAPAVSTRPLVVVNSYSNDPAAIQMGQNFTVTMAVVNNGQTMASNILVEFSGTDFLPRQTGGVQSISTLAVGASATLVQPMVASWDLWGKAVGTIGVKISYTDVVGTSYSDLFTLTINLAAPAAGSSVTKTPTPTTTSYPRPQFVINAYNSDVDPLQPGTIFNLQLEIVNLGGGDAFGVTMVLGGSSGVDLSSGTPVPSGSGGNSDLTNFAPLGSSNLVYLGNVQAAGGWEATQKLIVNVSTQPGAYPLKISFVYSDSRGVRLMDDQVITLLVYSLPQVDIGFYRDPGIFYVGQQSPVPLQVTNLGKKTNVLGNMSATVQDADFSNNVSLIGALDPGGYFTLDALLTPMQAGTLEITVTINYNDDFNQARTIVQTISVEVQDAAPLDGGIGPGIEGGIPSDPTMSSNGIVTEETLLDKIWRFIRGLLGLDSSLPQPVLPAPDQITPSQSVPLPKG